MEIRYVDDIWNRILSKNISIFYIPVPSSLSTEPLHFVSYTHGIIDTYYVCMMHKQNKLYIPLRVYVRTYVYPYIRYNVVSTGNTMNGNICNNVKVPCEMCRVAFYWIKEGFMVGSVERNNNLKLLLCPDVGHNNSSFCFINAVKMHFDIEPIFIVNRTRWLFFPQEGW